LEWKSERKCPPIPKERVVGIMNNIKPSKLGGRGKTFVQMFQWKKRLEEKESSIHHKGKNWSIIRIKYLKITPI
jgi:hypothetical protein